MDSPRTSFVCFAALLICMENTFWSISTDDNFVELFKKSFTLYVESGVRKQTEADIEKFINDFKQEFEDGGPVTDPEGFKEKFYKIIIEHRLPQPEDLLERKNRKIINWLRNLSSKIRRGLGRRV